MPTTDGRPISLHFGLSATSISSAIVRAVAVALDAVYRPGSTHGAKALQAAVGPEANSGTYAPSAAPTSTSGEVVVFVDGLRLDVAHLLVERLEGSGATVDLTSA